MSGAAQALFHSHAGDLRPAAHPRLPVPGWALPSGSSLHIYLNTETNVKEGRHTILRVNFRDRPLVPTHSQCPKTSQIAKWAQEVNNVLSSPPACRATSSGLCFLGNKEEHHNSVLTSKWHKKVCHFFSLQYLLSLGNKPELRIHHSAKMKIDIYYCYLKCKYLWSL